jgi:hypothetical protein
VKGKSCDSEYIGNPANSTVKGKPAEVKYLGNPVAKMYMGNLVVMKKIETL